MGSFQRLFRFAALAVILVPAYAATLMAAPQILAVASTTLDAKMQCFEGQCSAELSSICLQEDRSAPYAMTEYYIHGGKKLILTGHHADGRKTVISNLPLTIVAARGQNAVRVSFPESLMRASDLTMVSLSVPENITVIPVASIHDDKPQTAFDISLAASTLRVAATGIVDKNTKNKATAELVNHAINGLPVRGRADPKVRDQAKTQFLSVARAANVSTNARDRAVRIVSTCHADTTFGLQNYRTCLGSWHDMLLEELNGKFWDAVKTGS
ncbi:MAG: hypothetical protein JKX94_04955 [Sneathiella sp.]|nr:hypothetical protein [Sneathiella sp.]